MSDHPGTTRRHFLHVLAGSAAIASTGAIAGCSSSAGQCGSSGQIAAGKVSSLSVGNLRKIPGQSVCIGRDANGIYAMTLICTHECCDMGDQGSVTSSGLSCSCHDSKYDVHGNVTQGPATEPLEHFAVTQDAGGNLTVDADATVPATTRLVV